MKLLREPLLHFVLGGALLFGVHAWLNRDAVGGAGGETRIVRITERELTWIVETSTRQWQRAPTESEVQGLVADYLREELLAREARALELDRDDTVVRRRLAQKMNFVIEDTARLSEPTEAELQALFEAQRARLTRPALVSFEQIYFSRDKRGARAEPDARQLLARLERDSVAGRVSMAGRLNPAQLGDPSLLPAGMAGAEEAGVSGVFGAAFAAAVVPLAPGSWQGPFESAFGLHLVRVTERQDARPLSFEEARADLLADWRRERETEAKNAYFGGLLGKYDVQVSEALRPLLEPALAAMRDAAREAGRGAAHGASGAAAPDGASPGGASQ